MQRSLGLGLLQRRSSPFLLALELIRIINISSIHQPSYRYCFFTPCSSDFASDWQGSKNSLHAHVAVRIEKEDFTTSVTSYLFIICFCLFSVVKRPKLMVIPFVQKVRELLRSSPCHEFGWRFILHSNSDLRHGKELRAENMETRIVLKFLEKSILLKTVRKTLK